MATPSSPAPAPQPPPAPKRKWRWVLLAIVVALGVTIVWFDLPGVVRGEIARQRALENTDPILGLFLWNDAARLNPSEDLKGALRNAENHWTTKTQSDIDGLSPAERFLYFRDPARLDARQLLREPVASAHAAFVAYNADLTLETMQQQFEAALGMLEEGDAEGARRQMAALERTAAAAEDFPRWRELFAEAELNARLQTVVTAAEDGDFDLARNLLSALKDESHLPQAAHEALAFQVELSSYAQSLARAVELAKRSDQPGAMELLASASRTAAQLISHPGRHAILAGLPEAERDASIVQLLNAHTQVVQRLADRP